jgi:multimeric flavodoxin WrbA/nitrite reductase/ring-hydroxylating ferredoxin subunit
MADSETAGARWHDLGEIEELRRTPLCQVTVGQTRIALSFTDGRFGAVSGNCNHAGGPLGDGALDADGYIVCPWHHWKFHCRTGLGEPGFEDDRVPSYELREEGGRLFVNLQPATRRNRRPHPPHPLARPVERGGGPLRLLGISTTNMDVAYPRYSTSDALLDTAVSHAASSGAEVRLLRLAALRFRACEGYYSKSAHACTWPCSITQMDPADQMEAVYEGIVHWADAIVVSTPIRWGSASSLYFKMVERMNCIQNQVTLRDRVLLRNKVAAFIITGGQDNVQAVAGQMLGFFAEIGCMFPQFPYIAHSRGWSAEDMENNVAFVQMSEALRDSARQLVDRTLATARAAVESDCGARTVDRAGRKAGAPGMEPMEADSPAGPATGMTS